MDAVTSRRYHAFADWARDSSPLYAEWATGIAGDDELTELIARLGERRGQPNLVFAAARWAGCGLEPFADWRERLVSAWDEVAAITAERRTQTNEVGRCATLLPPLSRIDGPIALLETGTAAGLCLYPDRYAYEYSSPGGEPLPAIVPERPDAARRPLLRCRIDDPDAAPGSLPDVVWRTGIDLAPIDVWDADAVAWLETLIWPGRVHDERVERLRTAVDVARADPPRIVPGDILDLLPEVAAESPPEATLVVFHSAVLLYLDADERRRFADLVSTLGQRVNRRVVWISNETAGTLPEIDGRMPRRVDTTGRFVQTVDGVPVALAGQHGATYEVSPFRP
ncbi:DUF2332 domain-containing protein [Microbacterium sp. Yaish 1]|uniref:DUF2332 domain-containing protein n=1 Tax=Microbacterium sp. Yaish 1 TaxID=2025014 RepID=UPI000B94603D|nr:DUF2332 domain-containing protein [Microbacterium sp. Yaish 1]OYC97401.1 hypothetical protein CI089_02315 [Microbacterium sp. Yaish 1]